MTYLQLEYKYLCVLLFFFSIVILCAVDLPWVDGNLFNGFPYTTFAYYLGAATSMLTGFIGVRISTRTSILTAYQLNTNREQAIQTTFAASQVYGFILPSFAVGILNILLLSYRPGVIYYIGGNGSQDDITKQCLTTF
jgi:K(+)-stimulated pyrophosphate-energized sodium pump